MKNLRGLVVKLVIGSFSLAALLGIIALLAGGDLDGTPGKVLFTTLVVGVESVAVLCYLSAAGARFAVIGLLGGLVSLVPFGISLWLIWLEPDTSGDWIWKASLTGLTLAASLAQACLVLAASRSSKRGVGPVLRATLLAIAVVAGMVIGPILFESGESETYWRLFGVIAILDVLGTVTVAALSRFGTNDDNPDAPVSLDPAQQARVLELARRRGTTPQQVIHDALDRLPD